LTHGCWRRSATSIGVTGRSRRRTAESGLVASQLGLPKPSYEQVRTVVHASRNGKRYYGVVDAYIDLSFQAAPARAIVERLLEREPLPERK
jgi:hypothetical protein